MKFNIQDKYKNECGVYIIKSLIDERVYVGSTKNLYKRYKGHISALTGNKHYSTLFLQAFVNAHSINNLEFNLLELCGEKIRLEREHYYTVKYASRYKDHGFNDYGRNVYFRDPNYSRLRELTSNSSFFCSIENAHALYPRQAEQLITRYMTMAAYLAYEAREATVQRDLYKRQLMHEKKSNLKLDKISKSHNRLMLSLKKKLQEAEQRMAQLEGSMRLKNKRKRSVASPANQLSLF